METGEAKTKAHEAVGQQMEEKGTIFERKSCTQRDKKQVLPHLPEEQKGKASKGNLYVQSRGEHVLGLGGK